MPTPDAPAAGRLAEIIRRLKVHLTCSNLDPKYHVPRAVLDDLADAVSLVARLREQLEALEWYESWGTMCPVCGKGNEQGHAPDCALAALLAEAAG